ncbi:MAG TPA: LysE family translocator [Candidatus Limnocylindrales bacterium]|nr:LysE family translocator [Candidatus Limnocylindrales bacterium]
MSIWLRDLARDLHRDSRLGVAAALGIATILATSSVAFTILKFAGAAYLIYLGISTLRSRDDMTAERGDSSPRLPARQAWLQGMLSSLLNPKLGVFFLTLLPQFIEPDVPAALRALQLALVFDLIGLAWLLLYSAMLAVIGDALGRSGPRRFIRWVSGTLLVALGVRVALERA